MNLFGNMKLQIEMLTKNQTGKDLGAERVETAHYLTDIAVIDNVCYREIYMHFLTSFPVG